MGRGIFITLEGIEGSGKSTQLKRLAQWLREQNRQVIETREPGGTVIGTSIRNMLLDPEQRFQDPHSELLLFTVDRLEHIKSVIQPAIDRGDWVLSDRYIDSSYAYQRGGRELPESFVMQCLNWAPVIPDITVLIDLDIQEGLARAKARQALDRFEQESLAFHERVRQAYLDRAAADPTRMICIRDEGKGPDAVTQAVIAAVSTHPKIQEQLRVHS